MGITRVANVTGLDIIGIPVVMVCRPNSRSLSVSQGKGISIEAAIASGLMESVESFHAERVSLPLRLATYNELKLHHRVANVERLPREQSSPFHADLPILWVEAFDLMNRQPVWLPFDLVHTNFSLNAYPGSGSFMVSSNGLSSGNQLLEAIVSGLCEVIERDAHAFWLGIADDKQKAKRLDLNTVDDTSRELLAQFEAAGVGVAVWDMTHEVGVAAFRCTIVDLVDRGALHALPAAGGFGCHPTREIALSRALTEAAQSRLTCISGSRDDLLYDEYELVPSPDVLRDQRRLVGEVGERALDATPTVEHSTVNEDLRWLLERLRLAGFDEVLAVDLTLPRLGLSVVRVVVPGCEVVGFSPLGVPGPRMRRAMEAS